MRQERFQDLALPSISVAIAFLLWHAVVTLLDEREATCQVDTHENGNRIPDLADVRTSSKVTLNAERQRQS